VTGELGPTIHSQITGPVTEVSDDNRNCCYADRASVEIVLRQIQLSYKSWLTNPCV
jgi:hypothetical protein